ncbi:MAG: hypothetical protein HY928_09485 [Elusimicrobia bacterium]|nr:hypothetical protein [Elusimicrobiota bacterium]
MEDEEQAEPDQDVEVEGGGRWSRAAAVLYIPLLLGILRYVIMAGILLFYRSPAGLYVFPYIAVFLFLARRAYRLAAGRAAASLLTDAVLVCAADLLVAAVFLL